MAYVPQVQQQCLQVGTSVEIKWIGHTRKGQVIHAKRLHQRVQVVM